MCGLAGIARLGGRPSSADHDDLLARMTRAVAHRGPDETVFGEFGAVDLGFARLSLVNPANGGQPLTLGDGAIALIANGEIYNYRELAASLPAGTRFRTGSDCEVLLHLYRRDGLAFLDRVRGMFALVLWDRERQRLVFARDRFGIKPLYYHRDTERIVFGSEIKALFEDPRTPRSLDWERALSDQMVTGLATFETGPAHSWFQGIEFVPAATIVTFDTGTGQRHEQKYWDFPSYDGRADCSAQEIVLAYGEALTASISECATADVQVGLFLSGGIDSAAIAALASPRPRTFTALNASTLLNQDAEYAHRIAARFGLDNSQVLFDARHIPSVEEWKNHLWLVEAPIAGAESFYKYEMYRYVRQHAPEIKAMLLGVGSDEFNGGYSVTMAGGGDWSDFAANVDRMGLRRALSRRPDLGVWWDNFEHSPVRADVLWDLAGDSAGVPYARYHRWKYRDVQQYNNWHEDRSAAGNGIEARVPFLDHRVVEIAAAVPSGLRHDLIWDKAILRRAMHDVLPQEFLGRPKVPFFYGDGVRHTYRTFVRMLAQDEASLLEQALAAPGSKSYLDADHMRATLASLQADPGTVPFELFLNVVNLGLLEAMALSPPSPPVTWRAAPVAESVAVNDWQPESARIEEQVFRRSFPALDQVVALAEGSLLLCDVQSPGTWYLAVNGAIEYEVDDTAQPQWVAFLRELDGVRDLNTVLAAAGVDADTIADLLTSSLDEGVLRMIGASPLPAGGPT